jgi:hypothetical protein
VFARELCDLLTSNIQRQGVQMKWKPSNQEIV